MTEQEFQEAYKNRRNAIFAACPGIDEATAGEYLAAGLSDEAAGRKWAHKLIAERDEARALAQSPPASRQRGAQPLTDGGAGGADAVADNGFMQLVKEHMEKTGCNYRHACHAMAKRHPESHNAYIRWCAENAPLRDDATTERRTKAGRV